MHIRVINPNTTQAMTDTIGTAATAVAAPGTRISATQPSSGPVSIESHFDEAVSVLGVIDEIRAGERDGVDAYVIACFGDPGLNAARELTRAPVIGIAEAAFHAATLISTRFSVVTTLPRTTIIAEHLLDSYGMASRCRRVRAADIPVLELEANPDLALERIIEECLKAKQEDGIGAIVLGCGGMADLTPQISAAVGLPIVEGVTAAVKLAEALVGLGLQTSKHGDLDFPPPKPFTGRFAEYSNLTPD
ncbi:Asp/Glu/hydantoin racemase [Pseudomonas abyssi]|jgi:allantoin racemase|uniref:Hydantoin racemase n=2 Tax=Pseudomonas abyssi TaxID=170540 RepID=A0A2A3MGZ5_9PSED|nr:MULTISPECIES: aspartate/glutamate racemase family protein [Pseudomonadaceae]MAC98356.1 aspartate/glutamate racemase family protein [Pseudomonadales bacterium]MAG64824.1 aspartate/glutamate racemase family protein [Pseudomonadales bacterium]PBK04078.1 Asp/Glu/hydantoin racemase [Pseudomonas abyssi]RGP53026.1 Asp/Glu/hydantoin racemase [Halopseudomonas gallaeciensis]|tara:strand:- start:103226 stop:103969 length:744 start_codon:yes stop_codon:yes gene_type:complete